MRKTIATVLGSMLGCSTAYADSINFTVENDYSAAPKYVSTSQSFTDTFNIGANLGLNKAITGKLTFIFRDDEDQITYTHTISNFEYQYTTSHGCGFFQTCLDYHNVFTNNDHYIDDSEVMRMDWMDQNSQAVFSRQSEMVFSHQSRNNWNGNTESIYNVYNNIAKPDGLGYYGPLILSLASLDILNSSNDLHLTISSLEGDFEYLGAKLDISAISSVPVPAALPLLASALGLFGFARSRKTV